MAIYKRGRGILKLVITMLQVQQVLRAGIEPGSSDLMSSALTTWPHCLHYHLKEGVDWGKFLTLSLSLCFAATPVYVCCLSGGKSCMLHVSEPRESQNGETGCKTTAESLSTGERTDSTTSVLKHLLTSVPHFLATFY